MYRSASRPSTKRLPVDATGALDVSQRVPSQVVRAHGGRGLRSPQCPKMRLSLAPIRRLSGWVFQKASESGRNRRNRTKTVELRRILEHSAPVLPKRGEAQTHFGPVHRASVRPRPELWHPRGNAQRRPRPRLTPRTAGAPAQRRGSACQSALTAGRPRGARSAPRQAGDGVGGLGHPPHPVSGAVDQRGAGRAGGRRASACAGSSRAPRRPGAAPPPSCRDCGPGAPRAALAQAGQYSAGLLQRRTRVRDVRQVLGDREAPRPHALGPQQARAV